MQHLFIFSEEKKYRLRRHLAFWLFWWLFFAILYSYTGKVTLLPNFRRFPFAMLDSVAFLLAHMFLAYTLIYYIIPRFVNKGKYLQAGIWVLVSFVFTASISALIGIYVLPFIRLHLFGIRNYVMFNSTYLMALLAGLRGAITIGGLAAAIKLMKNWYIKEQRNLQLQKENAEAGLQLLKAQLHPHFLFNTLNNIYSYTQNVSPLASEMLTTLSVMLRYILYEANQPLVPLQKELKMIQDYIHLENIRYGNRPELHMDIPEQTNTLYIAPLILLPLVENCFKHGASHMLDQPWINLHMSIEGNELQMKLMNGKVNRPRANKNHDGIGLKNVHKRLSILYPGKHDLGIINDENVFIVNLKLELEPKKGEIKMQPQNFEMIDA